MKYIKQFVIILTVSFLGEVLRAVLPLPVPASIYGLLLMLLALCTGVIPLDSVRETGRFLIEIMPLMFIPAAVGLIESWDKISPIVFELIVITAVSTVLVMVLSGRVTQWVIRRENRKSQSTGEAEGK
ncbi:MAG TPA: CidA/LrgA family protein [Candidatus Choladousia intestinavium]|uniref:CidA/LrgA family protein n=1 Tax=Candidatus Choladousia intestinavium TaxID=2840727 RepID=A0A9D1AEK4_9FIRM|nr:CidA/LrgA family protein [Candidatus Choladousia intestinavium]